MADYETALDKIIKTPNMGSLTNDLKSLKTDSDEEKILNANNIFTRKQIDSSRFEKFSRFGILDPYFSHQYSREYLFFTRPDLNIFKSDGVTLNDALMNSNYFTGAVVTNIRSLQCLQDTFMKNFKSNYITWNYLLSNQVSSNLDMPSISSEMTRHNATLYGVAQSFRDSSRSTEYEFEFNLEFTDTIDLDVYHFFKAYNEYCNLEYERTLMPHSAYIENPIRYKDFSIYKIVVNDYNKIIYYGKHTGVTIKGLPTDSLSTFDGVTKFSIPMHSFHVTDLNPSILTEINMLSSRAVGSFSGNIEDECLPLYDEKTKRANTDWSYAPFITSEKKPSNSSQYDYYLKWRKI